ncbi:hypothetical protein [Flavobacterium luminosum]|uniref:Lipoprotein n=1 Tax=Flavobacterium luminosum TaxID=2949086 RepID=A0ABT0TQL1_9FLAO|nr:hypothetical protein [Flavobacterium sp. HXWNR70]MCL9809784.1 hypothetical protein [Flavobacterium sp. HXWNR70]
MKKLTLLFTASILLSCGASINSNFQTQNKPLTIEDKVAFLDVQHKVPETAIKLGDGKFGDTGFSTDCDFNSNLVKARKLARQNGANIVKLIEKKTPDIWSSCYRLKIEYYFYEGNVSELPQYQLQIN